MFNLRQKNLIQDKYEIKSKTIQSSVKSKTLFKERLKRTMSNAMFNKKKHE